MRKNPLVLTLLFLLVTSVRLPAQQSETDHKLFENTKASAEKGDADAQITLAVAYATGVDVEQNQQEADKWFRKAAAQGKAEALTTIGIRYWRGIGCSPNVSEAAKWFKMAMEKGDDSAKSFLIQIARSMNEAQKLAAGITNLPPKEVDRQMPEPAKSERPENLLKIKELMTPEMFEACGLKKLTDTEKANLNSWLGSFAVQILSSKQAGGGQRQSSGKAFITRIESDKNNILKLENEAVVEITSGYVGYVGYRKNAVLYKSGTRWFIWIAGKKAFACDVIRMPSKAGVSFEKVTISKVSGGGSLLVMEDGSICEVDELGKIETLLWIGQSDALIIDGTKLINLSEGGDIVEIKKIK